MDKVVIEVTRKDIEDYLRGSSFKPTPEVVTAILESINETTRDGELFGIIESCLWHGKIPDMLESV